MRQYVSIRRNSGLSGAPTVWLFLGILLPAAAFLSLLRLQPWAPAAELPRIMAGAAGLLWIGTAAICLFTAVLIRAARGDRAGIRFLLVAGLVTLWLALDHAFALHQEVPLAATLAAGALYLIVSWRVVLANRPALLAAAGLFLAASFQAEPIAPNAPELAEAGLAFLAVAFWAGFHVAAAGRAVEELATGRITAVALSSHRLLRRPA